MDPQPGKTPTRWTRHGGMGVEFAAAVAGFGLAGYWIDTRYATGPWALLIGVGLGLVGGTYNLIRQSMAAFKQLDEQARERQDEQDQH